MREEQILSAIAIACENDSLRLQIIIQDDILHVYINRPMEAELDYQELKSKIYDVIIHKFPSEFSEIWLYCRIFGEIEPDWQATLEIDRQSLDPAQISEMIREISGAVSATHLIVDKIERELEIQESFTNDTFWDFEELPTTASENESELDLELLESLDQVILELDLDQYCFVDNQRLLYAVLNIPQKNIARLVDRFDRFELSTKRSQLPALQIYFNQSIVPNLNTLDPETQSWWQEINALDYEQKQQLAIWLSRYCVYPEQTISTIAKAFVPQIARKNQRLWQTNNSIKHKLSQSTPQENQNTPQTQPELKSGIFFTWLMLLRQFFQKIK